MIAVSLAIPFTGGLVLALLDGRRRLPAWLSVAVIAASSVAVLALAREALSSPAGEVETVAGGWPAGIGIRLRADPLGLVFAGLAHALLMLILVFEVLRGVRFRAFPALLVFLAGSLNGLFFTSDVFNFYVFFEVSMAATFVLTFAGEHRRFLHAGFIFMAVTLLASVLLLVGVVALYHIAGTLDMDGVARVAQGLPPQALILIATVLFVAFAIKLGSVPFHSWVPAVYEKSSPATAAILSGVVASVGGYGLIRFGADLFPDQLGWAAPALFVVGGASIVYGAVVALSRPTTPGVLAYSSISQAGYVIVALAVGGAVGIGAAIVFSAANAMNKSLLFLAADGGPRWGSVPFLVGALSVAGIPPTAGFFGKAAIVRAGALADDVASLTLVLLGSALSIGYLFRLYQRRFWRTGEDRASAGTTVPWALAIGVLALGVWPAGLLTLSTRAAEGLAAAVP